VPAVLYSLVTDRHSGISQRHDPSGRIRPRYVSELAAHQISTLTICVLVGIYTWALSHFVKL
jgi:hypothetical protein